MPGLSLSAIAAVCGITYEGHYTSIHRIVTDSRIITTGDVFVAIIGEKYDGHHFLADAYAKGAVAAIVSHIDPTAPLLQWVVNNTVQTLGQLAAYCRQQYPIPLIAITGSTGKTTTKNLVAAILCAAYGEEYVLSSQGGFNNHIGVPLTLLRLAPQHSVAAVEMGMNHLGEIAYLTQMAKPDVAVITNAGPCHLEGVGSLAGVAQAKGEIFAGLHSQGTAILNKESPFFKYWVTRLEGQHVLSFGLHPNAGFFATDIKLTPSVSFILNTPQGAIDIHLALLGQHNIENALAAAAATTALGIDLPTIKKGLESVLPINGRLREHVFANGLRIIDDAYNANPLSVSAAINTLTLYEGTTVLVLGDMKELGTDATQFHRQIGELARTAGVTHLFAIGEWAKHTCTGFGASARHAPDRATLVDWLVPLLQPKTTILIKGSASTRMQDVVTDLLSNIT